MPRFIKIRTNPDQYVNMDLVFDIAVSKPGQLPRVEFGSQSGDGNESQISAVADPEISKDIIQLIADGEFFNIIGNKVDGDAVLPHWPQK